MTFAPLLLALLPFAQGPQTPAGGAGEPVEVDRLIAIVNDQVLTYLQISRDVEEIAQQRGLSPETPGFFGAMARNRLVDMLFREGFRQSGLDEDVVDAVVTSEMNRRIEAAGSVATFEMQLERRGTTMALESKKTKQALIGLYFQQSELGRSPQLGTSAFQAFLTVPPNEIRSYYEENRGEFHRERLVEARILMISKAAHPDTEAFVRELRAQVTDMASFAKIASEHSSYQTEAKNLTGLIDPLERSFAAGLKDFLISGTQGELSEALELQPAWALVQIIEVQPERTLTVGEAHIEIEDTLLARKRFRILQDAVDRMRKRCYIWHIPQLEGLLDDVYGLNPVDEEEL